MKEVSEKNEGKNEIIWYIEKDFINFFFGYTSK